MSEEGKCCYCGFGCNPLSQACGQCVREMNFNPSSESKIDQSLFEKYTSQKKESIPDRPVMTPSLEDRYWIDAFKDLIENNFNSIDVASGWNDYTFTLLRVGDYVHQKTMKEGRVVKTEVKSVAEYKNKVKMLYSSVSQ